MDGFMLVVVVYTCLLIASYYMGRLLVAGWDFRMGVIISPFPHSLRFDPPESRRYSAGWLKPIE
jgi:hypothetical protein